MTRIARGSGTSVAEVKILLDEHKKLKGMMNKVTNVNKSKTYNTSHLMNKLQ
jgi:signal recognition particle GTPase